MIRSYLIPLVLVISLIFTAVSCDSDDHDDHGEVPVGFQLTANDQMLVTQESGTLTYAAGETVLVPLGSENEVSIQFIADDGDYYTPEAGEYGLSYTLSNDNVISVVHPLNGDEWSFQVTGENEGEVEVTISLMHEGHADFESQPISVTVFNPEEQS